MVLLKKPIWRSWYLALGPRPINCVIYYLPIFFECFFYFTIVSHLFIAQRQCINNKKNSYCGKTLIYFVLILLSLGEWGFLRFILGRIKTWNSVSENEWKQLKKRPFGSWNKTKQMETNNFIWFTPKKNK